MDKVQVKVSNITKVAWREAELFLGSGIIKYPDGEYSHISKEPCVMEIAPVVVSEPVPEVVAEIVPGPVKEPEPESFTSKKVEAPSRPKSNRKNRGNAKG